MKKLLVIMTTWLGVTSFVHANCPPAEEKAPQSSPATIKPNNNAASPNAESTPNIGDPSNDADPEMNAAPGTTPSQPLSAPKHAPVRPT